MKKFLLVVACAISALTVSAQRASSSSSSFFSTESVDGGVRWGIRAGVNFANSSFSSGNYSVTPDSRTAFHVGVVADFPLMESLYIQSGLFFQNKGCKIKGEDEYDETTTYKPMYLEIPILASYRYNFNDATQLQVNFGPYFDYGIGGKIKYESDGDSDEEDIFGDDGMLKRFNCGLQVGAGVTFASHIYLGVSYQFGLTNIYNDEDDDSDFSIKDKNWMISLGYNF